MLATLSVVFAFVFAPAGLILGHLGLAQIRHTGQRGRDRALVGVTLSYVFITAVVVALIVGTVMPDSSPTRAAPATTTPRLPSPTVAPADLDRLLPTLDDVKNMTGDTALTVYATYHRPTLDPQASTIDRPDCLGAFGFGEPAVYDMSDVGGYSESNFLDTNEPFDQWSIGGAVAAYHDAATAQAQLAKLQSIWRRCGGSTVNETRKDGKTYPLSMMPSADAGNGITTMDNVSATPIRIFGVRAIAAKTNVVIDVGVWATSNADRSRQTALAIANFILNKIPG
ncbi:hypothetical protein MMAN_18320 [Mycobacterium mantenii]|uniref:Nuclease PIN n=1 Tax=Mycobacterium mantenii TaxID=560555 RepID=A0ABN6A3H8_MYCNT|nr:sensor domain-containing protein [Mycobacterium mantenii]MCV7245318.1 sensor domain-containing protein [Mycobacterium mantenii]BBY37698.1 hypothetical protein MMAN_18320 [Mycobacterium mantenii]